MGLEVIPVAGRAERRAFLELPWRLYRDDRAWRAPLRLERRLHLSEHNPFLRHGEWQPFLACRDGEPVGRVSAQIDTLHRARYGPDTGHFGLLEGVDDAGVFAALLEAAEGWLAARGTRRVTGPFNLSINQECGLLVDGFDTPPVVLMPHGRPWYGRHVEAAGYRPVRDLLAYWIHTDFDPPRVMRALIERYAGRIRVRPLNKRALACEVEILRDLFNDAWAENWGFVPFTREELADLGRLLRFLLPQSLVQIAELDGAPAAFIVGLPDLNAAAADLDGRLLPFGWLKLLARVRGGRVSTGRVPLMGVRRRYQRSPLGSALAFAVIDAVKRALYAHGIGHVEMSWILGDNAGMRSILEAIGSRVYKRYRLYEKALAASAAS